MTFQSGKFEEHLAKTGDRDKALRACVNKGAEILDEFTENERHCLLEVLFLGNRAVAHPNDGMNLDHKVGETEMTTAINVVLKKLQSKTAEWPELRNVKPEFLQPAK